VATAGPPDGRQSLPSACCHGHDIASWGCTVPSHTWIEVYHEFNDCVHANGGRAHEIGWWAHYAPGSGVWANVGTTLITGARGYRVACTATAQLTNRSSAACDQCCTPAHELLFMSASELNYTSMQSCCGQRGGTGQSTQFEIVFFTRTCDKWRNNNSSACPRKLNLRSGRTRAFLRSHERDGAAWGETANAALRLSKPAVHDTGMCKNMGRWRR